MGEGSDLQKRVASAQSEISSVQELIDKEHAEKLEFKHTLRLLEKNLEHRMKDMEKMSAEALH